MVKNKDKWSALSMKERADLIKLYVNNGITSLNDIKKDYNNFDDGGDTKDENKTLGYTTTSQQDLQGVETFNSNWFKYRDSQLANSARRNPHRFGELNSLQKAFPLWISDAKLANLSRDWINNRLSSVVETHTSEALKDEKHRKILKEIYCEYFPYGAVDSKTLTPREITDSDLKYIDQLRGGTYIIPDHTIIYADGNQNTTAKIHERLHAAQPTLPYSVDRTPIGRQDGVHFDKYYDSQREIYARLMELRYANKLDPSHTYTIKEVKAMRNDPNFKDFHLFDRYTDEYILMLLNEVAQNNIDENRLDYVNPENIAASGGKLNIFDIGGDAENNQSIISEELNPSVVVDYSNLKQEAKDARDWVFDYYASEGYKNRAKQAGLTTRNPLKKHLGIFPKKKLRFEEDWSVDSSYNWLYPVIGLQESENPFTSNLTDEIGFITAHEFAHNSKLFNTPAKSYEETYRSPYYTNSYKKVPTKYSDALEVKQLVNPHDMELSESYSDLVGLRYLLDKYNIFDSKDSNAVFDSKMYNSLIQDERFKNNRFLKLHEERQVIDAINNVAQNTTNSNRLDYVNPNNIAACGGKINRFATGGPKDRKHVRKYLTEMPVKTKKD